MERSLEIKKASILGMIGNIFLLIIKGIIGLISGSSAMMLDAFNSAGDIFSSVMTFIGNKIASKPSDDDHNLGHGKAEYIYSMLISIAIILTSLLLLKKSLFTIINKTKYNFSYFLLIVCILTIIVKLLLYLYTKNVYKKSKSILIKANSIDHRNDVILTTLNFISCLLALKGIYFFDGVVGIIIALFIIYQSVKLFKESYDVLMDKSISESTKKEVFKIINSHEEIKKVIHFNSTPVGYKYQISFTIYVDGNMTTYESHDIANNLEKEIDKKIDEIYLTVIHVNPI